MKRWTLAEIERDVVLCALWRHKGNKRKVAEELNVARSTIFSLCEKYEEDGEMIPHRDWFGLERIAESYQDEEDNGERSFGLKVVVPAKTGQSKYY